MSNLMVCGATSVMAAGGWVHHPRETAGAVSASHKLPDHTYQRVKGSGKYADRNGAVGRQEGGNGPL